MSNVAYCKHTETWPEAGSLPFKIISSDGEYAAIYGEGGHSEVVLYGPQVDSGALVVALRFDTLEQGLRAGKILSDAFAAVREIQDEEPVYHCEHRKIRFTFSPRLPEKYGICEGCAKNFGGISLKAYRDLQDQGKSDSEIAELLERKVNAGSEPC